MPPSKPSAKNFPFWKSFWPYWSSASFSYIVFACVNSFHTNIFAFQLWFLPSSCLVFLPAATGKYDCDKTSTVMPLAGLWCSCTNKEQLVNHTALSLKSAGNLDAQTAWVHALPRTGWTAPLLQQPRRHRWKGICYLNSGAGCSNMCRNKPRNMGSSEFIIHFKGWCKHKQSIAGIGRGF